MRRKHVFICTILLALLLGCGVESSAVGDSVESVKLSVSEAADKEDINQNSDDLEISEISFVFDQIEYSGNYTGDVKNGQPNGNGLFVADLEEGFFEYDGEWENGEPTGNGKLKTSSYGIPASNNKLWYGEYQGDIHDGVASGFGTYKTQNSSGNTWFYIGEWKDGVFSGKGKTQYDDGAYIEGTYTNGSFTPTPAEFFLAEVTSFYNLFNGKEIPVTDETKALIYKHEMMFQDHDISDYQGKIDTEFQAEEYLKDPAAYDAAIIQLPGFILQTGPEDVWGQEHAYAIFMTEPDTTPFLVLMHGHVSNSIKLYNVSLTAVPLGEYSYENPAGDRVRCVLCAGIAITAESRIG